MENSEQISIVLADDHHVVRHGLSALLGAERDFRVVGEAANGLEVADLVELKRPMVLVLDLMMPGLNGVEVIPLVAKRSPKTAILVLSMYASEAYVLEALRNGASGYVLKDANPPELLEAIRTVASGKRYLCPPLSERAIEAYMQREAGSALEPYDTLTLREREVLHLASEGYHNNEVAERLSISPRTVEVHRGNVMRKLGLRTQTDLIRYALKKGLIPPDQ